MPDEIDGVLGRLIGGDATAATEIRERPPAPTSVRVLVAAALLTDGDPEMLARATAAATTSRDRQLVAIAAAHLRGDDQLVDVLVRDHLVDHPDDVVAAWIASRRLDRRESEPCQ